MIPIEFDVASRLVWCGANKVRLTEKEAALFAILGRHAGRVAPHREILRAGLTDTGSYCRTVICRIRAKLNAAGIPLQITAVRGAGYATNYLVTFTPPDDGITISRDAIRIVRRLIEKCPSPTLAEQARQVVFDE